MQNIWLLLHSDLRVFAFFFLVWEIDPQLARTQPNSCIASLLPPTLQKLARALFVLANAQGFIIMYY